MHFLKFSNSFSVRVKEEPGPQGYPDEDSQSFAESIVAGLSASSQELAGEKKN